MLGGTLCDTSRARRCCREVAQAGFQIVDGVLVSLDASCAYEIVAGSINHGVDDRDASEEFAEVEICPCAEEFGLGDSIGPLCLRTPVNAIQLRGTQCEIGLGHKIEPLLVTGIESGDVRVDRAIVVEGVTAAEYGDVEHIGTVAAAPVQCVVLDLDAVHLADVGIAGDQHLIDLGSCGKDIVRSIEILGMLLEELVVVAS